jgi:ectoine hydroxylase-related dioxygenase (phytanoyl-CoA dioxygenase family)
VHPFAVVTADEIERAAASIQEHGAAIITDAVDGDVIDELRAVMLEELPNAATLPAALDVRGHVQHTPPPRAKYLYRDVIANPAALRVVREVIGPVQLTLYTGNTMLPGTTEQQPVHWDEPQLWRDHPSPAFSLTVNIPLVDVEVANGALEVWPGTHLDPRSGGRPHTTLEVPEEWLAARRAEVPPVRVPVTRGSILIRDGRLWHRGTTNSTDAPRPMVAVVYHAWWFRPLAVDFYADAEPVLRELGVRTTPRFRDEFDHQTWPPDFEVVAKPV